MNWLQQRKFQVLADQAVFSGTGFLLNILLARHLDASAFGWYSAYVLSAYLAMSAVEAWVLSVFQVVKEKTPRHVAFVFWWQIVLVAVVLGIALGANYIYPFCASNAPIWFGAGIVLYDFGRKLLLSLNKTLDALKLDGFISALLIASFVLFQKMESRDINVILGLFALVYLVSMVVTLFFSQPFSLNTQDILPFTAQHLRGGKWLFFTAISQWWASNLLVVASGVYLGTTALGALRLAQSIFGVLNVLLQTYEHYVLPQTVLRLHNSLSGGLHFLKHSNQKLAMAFVPVLLVAFVFAAPVMGWAGGSTYVPFAFVIRGLCLLYLLILVAQPIRFAVRALEFHRYFFYGYLLNLGITLATSRWLLSHFGLSGAIAGLIAAQAVLVLYWALILQQQKNINVWKSFI